MTEHPEYKPKKEKTKSSNRFSFSKGRQVEEGEEIDLAEEAMINQGLLRAYVENMKKAKAPKAQSRSIWLALHYIILSACVARMMTIILDGGQSSFFVWYFIGGLSGFAIAEVEELFERRRDDRRDR